MNTDVAERLGLTPRHMQIVADLLARHVPDRSVWAFGSRAFGRASRYSDLDLAIGGGGKLSASAYYDLHDALDESMLPVEVDLVDLNDIDASFRARIEPDFVLLQGADEKPDEF